MDIKLIDSISLNSDNGGTKASHDELLKKYFLNEVKKNSNILESIFASNKNGHFERETLQKMTQACNNIKDMAMIHGYRDIEGIAFKLVTLINSFNGENNEHNAARIKTIQSFWETLKNLTEQSIQPYESNINISERTIKNIEQPDGATNIRITEVRSDLKNSRFSKNNRESIFDINDFYNENSPESVEFRRVYSKLLQLNPDRTMKKFIVTSSIMGEGKSTTAAFLAITISKYYQAGTLLIDFDLRKPTIHKIFGLPQDNGVGEILEGKKTAKACFKQTSIPNLKILTCGNVTKNPAEFLDSPVLNKFFDEINFYFDIIIIDSAPVIPVSDSLILSPKTDGLLFVVKAGKTPREVARRGRNLIYDAGVNMLGVIINNMEGVLPYYYDSDYYGYEYYKNGKKPKDKS